MTLCCYFQGIWAEATLISRKCRNQHAKLDDREEGFYLWELLQLWRSFFGHPTVSTDRDIFNFP